MSTWTPSTPPTPCSPTGGRAGGGGPGAQHDGRELGDVIPHSLPASAFSSSTGNAYLTGLAIAGYTDGALLGAFLLDRLVPCAVERDAVIAFIATLGLMALVAQFVSYGVTST